MRHVTVTVLCILASAQCALAQAVSSRHVAVLVAGGVANATSEAGSQFPEEFKVAPELEVRFIPRARISPAVSISMPQDLSGTTEHFVSFTEFTYFENGTPVTVTDPSGLAYYDLARTRRAEPRVVGSVYVNAYRAKNVQVFGAADVGTASIETTFHTTTFVDPRIAPHFQYEGPFDYSNRVRSMVYGGRGGLDFYGSISKGLDIVVSVSGGYHGDSVVKGTPVARFSIGFAF